MEQPPRRIQYTDLNVWKRGAELSQKVGKETAGPAFARLPELRSQLYRATLSIASNIAEGEGQGTNRGTLKFYFIARGSLYEARSQLLEALNRGCVSKVRFDELNLIADDVARLIAGVIRARRAREQKHASRPSRPNLPNPPDTQR